MAFRKQKLKDKIKKETFALLEKYEELPCPRLTAEINKRTGSTLCSRAIAQHLKSLDFLEKTKINNVTIYSFKNIDSSK